MPENFAARSNDDARVGHPVRPAQLEPLDERPLVSVLITCRDRREFIEDAIASALDQSYPLIEVIVADDASTDGSAEVIAEAAAADPRIRLVHSPGLGTWSALNTAYRASSGQVLCILDSDDLFEADKVDTVVEVFRQHPRIGVVVHRLTVVAEDGETPIGQYPEMTRMPSGWLAPSVLLSGGLVEAGMPPSSGQCLRREPADLIFPLPRVARSQDVFIFSAASLLVEIGSVSRPIGRYRVHSGSMSGFGSAGMDRSRLQVENLEDVYQALAQWRRATLPGVGAESVLLQHSLSYNQASMSWALMRGHRIDAYRHSVLACRTPAFATLPWPRRAYLRALPFLPLGTQKALRPTGPIWRVLSRVRRAGASDQNRIFPGRASSRRSR
jgi:hypothetical protein